MDIKQKWIAFVFVAIMILMTVQNIYAVNRDESVFYQGYKAYRDETWKGFQQGNPNLYKVIMFFNPPWLNNAFGAVMTILAAVSALMFMMPYEHIPGIIRFFFGAIGFYAWGRIFCFFIIMSIMEKGTMFP